MDRGELFLARGVVVRGHTPVKASLTRRLICTKLCELVGCFWVWLYGQVVHLS